MNKTLLHISLIPGIGPAVVKQLAQFLSYDKFEQLYTWSLQDFMYRARLSQSYADKLVKGLFDKHVLEHELALIKKHGVQWTTCADEAYPKLLQETAQPPVVLYWRGVDLRVFDQSIALVGSRKAHAYAQQFIDAAVPELAQAGWTIVSGGALGADAMAHRAALAAGVPTCAVIGSGLLRPYPGANIRLFEQMIANGGALVSPFPLEMGALPGNFPARNRIISGMSRATVVVQAASKSGARITALYALEQGREVCAVPGPLYDPLSAGCHALIQEGAALVASGFDILQTCGYGASLVRAHVAATVAQVRPSQPEDPIVALCRVPQSFDDLLDALEYDFAQLQERLLALQLQGALSQDFLGRWSVHR